MKRIFFSSLLLSLVLFIACKPTATDDGRVGVRGAKPDQKSVAILVFEEGGVKKILAIPETVVLEKGKHKVHFSAHNNLEQKLDYVEIDFGAEDPLEDCKTCRINGIETGDKDDKTTGKAKGEVGRSYKYTIRARVTGTATDITLDPQVEISGAH